MTEPSPFAGSPDLAAPEFYPDVEWINVPAPLTLQDLRGKIVLLDFWTYGCINCIHMIPVIEQLQERYGDALAVISIHSAKFENEGETENIRQIVQRYELQHPVINDNQFIVWRQFGAQAWPTFVIIDPRGNVLARQAGEIPFEAFDRLLTGMVEYFDSTGELDRTPLELTPEGADRPANLLAFPGKVLADAAGGRLFISDTNHHRIIVTDLETYEVQQVIGTSARGFVDGALSDAQFNKPHGLAVRGDLLYVADTENHAIRVIDLATGTVSTVAGTGANAFQSFAVGERLPALTTNLRSPWDVTFGDGDTLYIAMAGSHQIWSLDLAEQTVGVVIGNGRESALNGTLRDSELAQPSGLFYRDGVLYFADSESSTIRAADFAEDRVYTVSGTLDNNLFDYGDVDGVVGESRLQHPLSVTGGAEGVVLIADTYNNRIKALDPATNSTQTLYGSSDGGFVDGIGVDAAFYEPGGISYADGLLFVADTNNHAIRVIDLATNSVQTIQFANPETLLIGTRTTVIGVTNVDQVSAIALEAQTVSAGEGALIIRLQLEEGYKINPDAPSQIDIASEDGVITPATLNQSFRANEISVPLTLSAGDAVLYVHVQTYFCEDERETLCFLDDVYYELPVNVTDDADSAPLLIERAITPPQIDIGGFSGLGLSD